MDYSYTLNTSLPQKDRRATRDLLRRRLFFVRQRAELSVHLQNTNHQYNINDIIHRLNHNIYDFLLQESVLHN